MMHRILLFGAVAGGAAVWAGGCSDSPEAVCDRVCAKTEECGGTCTCNTSDYDDCDNRDEIFDHLDSCADMDCEGFTNCLLDTPECEGGSGGQGGSSSATTGSGGTTSTGGGSGGTTGSSCEQLAAECSTCTDPAAQTACAETASSGDEAACETLLDDPCSGA